MPLMRLPPRAPADARAPPALARRRPHSRAAVVGTAVAGNEMAQSQGTQITQSQGTQMTQSMAQGTSRRDRSRGERVPGNAVAVTAVAGYEMTAAWATGTAGYAVPWNEMTAARATGTTVAGAAVAGAAVACSTALFVQKHSQGHGHGMSSGAVAAPVPELHCSRAVAGPVPVAGPVAELDCSRAVAVARPCRRTEYA